VEGIERLKYRIRRVGGLGGVVQRGDYLSLRKHVRFIRRGGISQGHDDVPEVGVDWPLRVWDTR